ncbi:alanine/ornithine racemase family PLP-dependent enzyme [Acidobacteriota bacterium]
MDTKRNNPRLEIDLSKLAHNVRQIIKIFGSKGVSVFGVTKGVCGDPKIANIYLDNGIKVLAESRWANLARLRDAGITAPLLLLRSPSLNDAQTVVDDVDMSLQTEITAMKELSKYALRKNVKHKVILMVELGDLREGLMPDELNTIVEQVLNLGGLELAGIGANLGCLGGILVDDRNMDELSSLAQNIEDTFGIALEYISVGNSVAYSWLKNVEDVKRINNARLGESILLGGRDLPEQKIPGLHLDVFTLVAEVIEAKRKPSVPWGKVFVDAFGNIPEFEDRGLIQRVILNAGRQDVSAQDLIPRIDVEIIGATSDHLILDAKNSGLRVGDEVEFDMYYGALLAAMTSPYVHKYYINDPSSE